MNGMVGGLYKLPMNFMTLHFRICFLPVTNVCRDLNERNKWAVISLPRIFFLEPFRAESGQGVS